MKVFSFSTPLVAGVLAGLALPLPVVFAAGSNTAAISAHLEQPDKLRSMVPLDQLIVITRNKFGNQASDVVVHSARLLEQSRQKVVVIDFMDANNQLERVIYDAFSGKQVDHAPMQMPMPMEEILSKVERKYPGSNRTRTWLERQDGSMVYVIELTDKQFKMKRHQLTMDAYTGRVITDETYDMKPDGKQISLEQIINKAREKYRGMVVLRTRSRMKDNIKVREIVFLDGNRVRHKMVVNAVTGEVIEDRIAPLSWI
ncbi:PepSY domain-containing protein [Endozoicomonas sp. SCSIO W0465]|uniref:PepSY domain-containing protein n=1 Tax=Endozoicomonas sp. SCSIO W0465 TaxID=2918516 RepID=UPI0020755C93|nr:PepSY domain-containing protein [Endozoicomonas sp. SCSIO W0465]USE35678.1 PepSY domain-containing protein [Endozoicomonas sp. SCSIO W0465]